MRRPDAWTKSRGRPSWPWLTTLLAAIAASLWWSLGPAPNALVFDRSAIDAGEIWRLVTGHLVHSDAGHMTWNIGALILIGLLLEEYGRLRMMAAVLAGILAVDAGLWWGMTDIQRYCGLSGMLNALLVVALAEGWRRYRHGLFVAAAGLYFAKLVTEAMSDHALFVQTSWPSLPLAHVWGCLGGLIVVWAIRGLMERLLVAGTAADHVGVPPIQEGRNDCVLKDHASGTDDEQDTETKLRPHVLQVAIGQVGVKIRNEPIPNRFAKSVASAKQNAHKIAIRRPVGRDKEHQQDGVFE